MVSPDFSPEQGDKVQSKPKGIEAHEVALVAAAFALGLDSHDEHGRPSKSPPEQQFWPRFSEYLEGSQRTKANFDIVDAEQIYVQLFAFEQALGPVKTTNVRLAEYVLYAFDYYLRTLPQEHGIVFDYQIWSQRRLVYAKEWNEAEERIKKNPDVFKNPFYHLAYCFIVNMCHLDPDVMVLLHIALCITAKIEGFMGATSKWIVDRE